MSFEEISEKILGMIVEYGPRLAGAILALILGGWLIRVLVKGFGKMLTRSNVDESLKPFLVSLIRTLLRAMLFISVLGMVGIEMTSFVAILAAAGLAVGMALSGTLQNFAGGVMILLFKPFKVGDVLEAQGYIGSVKEIQIFNTILKTADNRIIIIPNGGLANGSMTNYSTEPTRRLEWTFGIGYGDPVEKAKELIFEIAGADDRILKDPEPFVAISELADSSVNLVVRAHVNSADYWAVHFDMMDKVYHAFLKHSINIPYPQMEVTLKKDA